MEIEYYLRLRNEEGSEFMDQENVQGVIIDKEGILQAPIKKANDIIRQSQFSLSLVESRIVGYMLANTDQSLKKFSYIQFRTKDFCNACGISKSNPQYVKNVIKRLYNKSIVVRMKRVDANQNVLSDSYVPIKILDDFEVEGKDGYVALKFHDRLAPYFLALQKNFTMYYFGYSVFFKSKYSMPLYELLRSYANLTNVANGTHGKPFRYRISMDNFRELMGLQAKLQYFADLKRRVLDICVEEINQYTDVNVSMECEKYGRAVQFLVFSITLKTNDERMIIIEKAKHKNALARKDVRLKGNIKEDDTEIEQAKLEADDICITLDSAGLAGEEIEHDIDDKPFLPLDNMREDILEKTVETITYFTTEDDETGQISISF